MIPIPQNTGLPYRSDAYVVVKVVGDTSINGRRLADAYDTARLLTPGGAALSATNRACVVIPPGGYNLAAMLVLDAEFVDIVAMVPQAAPKRIAVMADVNVNDNGQAWYAPGITQVYGTFHGDALYDGIVVKQTADDVRLMGFTIASLSADGDKYAMGFYMDADDNTPSQYTWMNFWQRRPHKDHDRTAHKFGANGDKGTYVGCSANFGAWTCTSAVTGDLAGTLLDCDAGAMSFQGDSGGVLSATMERCRCIGLPIGGYPQSSGFGGFAGCSARGRNISGTLIECQAGDSSFAIGKEITSTARLYRCIGGRGCFGSIDDNDAGGKFAGYAQDCVASGNSFGAGTGLTITMSGTLVNCRSTDMRHALVCGTSARVIGGEYRRDLVNNITSNDKGAVIFLMDDTSVLTGVTLEAATYTNPGDPEEEPPIAPFDDSGGCIRGLGATRRAVVQFCNGNKTPTAFKNDAPASVNAWATTLETKGAESNTQTMTNGNAGSIGTGKCVILKATADGNTFDYTTTAGDNRVWGVVTETIAAGASGRVMTQGSVTNLKVNGTDDIAIGDLLGTSATGGIAKKAAAGEMAFAVALAAYTNDDSSGSIAAKIIVPRKV